MIEPEAIAKRLDDRDGYKVVAYKEVGLPIFRLNCLMTLQEAGPLGAIEEFVLRCISQGVDTSTELETFLGLHPKIISRQLGQLMFEGAISQTESAPPRYGVTRAGRTRLEGAMASVVVREQVPIYVDGITRHVIDIEPHDTYTNAQLEQLEIAVMPPTPRRAPQLAEVDVGEINRMFASMSEEGRPKRRAVRLDAFTGRANLVFRRAVAVAFKSDDGRRVAFGFAIDGRESESHEIQYARSDDGQRSAIFGPMLDADRRRREVQKVVRELRADVPAIFPEPDRGRGGRPVLSIRGRPEEVPQTPSGKVRVLSVYDHPPLLSKAFQVARRRLLIVSPWIRANVVNDEFIRSLASCLERGVEVTIAFGIGRRDARESRADVQARESLDAMSRSFPNFRFVRKGDTHAKVLLVDDQFFVTTSFNWLSFRGDPKQPMREEEGTIVEEPEIVEAYYQKLIGRIEVARVGEQGR